MKADELKQEAIQELTKWQRHRFFILIAAVLIISMILVSISLSLYNSSGAAQVDLSLPSYQSIRKQAAQDRSENSFSSNGTLDADAFDSFDSLYASHLKRIGTENYDSRPLSDDSLQLFASPATQSGAATDTAN